MTRGASAAAVALAGAAVFGCALFGGGDDEPSEPAPRSSVRIRVEMLGGFPARVAATPERVALLIDATDSMGRPTETGTPRVRAARAAAQRFVATLDADSEVTLFALGDQWEARCETAPVVFMGTRPEISQRISKLSAGGNGSLASALDAFKAPEAGGGYERVVAITGLGDGCAGDLCAAVDGLAARGVRLDLVVVGGGAVPACLSDLAQRESIDGAGGWPEREAVGFHVESTGHDASVIGCGDTGGLAVEVPSGPSAVVVKLDPPLRVERSFPPGTRWLLQVVDFPALDPPERQWRWKSDAPPPPVGAEPREEGEEETEPES